MLRLKPLACPSESAPAKHTATSKRLTAIVEEMEGLKPRKKLSRLRIVPSPSAGPIRNISEDCTLPLVNPGQTESCRLRMSSVRRMFRPRPKPHLHLQPQSANATGDVHSAGQTPSCRQLTRARVWGGKVLGRHTDVASCGELCKHSTHRLERAPLLLLVQLQRQSIRNSWDIWTGPKTVPQLH